MPRAFHRSLIACLLLVAVAGEVGAQRLGPVQKRPKLAASADTNDASVYLAHGTRELEQSPDEAAAAFYWAARLDPSSADALYGRSVALAMRKPTTLSTYLYPRSSKARMSKDMLVMDSLYFRALRLDPLFYTRFYTIMQRSYIRNEDRAWFGSASPQEIDQYINGILEQAAPFVRGRVMYSNGRLEQALIEYEDALRRWKDVPSLRMERGRVYATQGNVANALRDFNDAIAQMRSKDEKKDENVIFYENKAVAEHSLGMLWSRKGDADSAKAAFGRATAEDLSYFPAHVALGVMALGLKDTASAIGSLALAADLATDEPYVHYLQGSVLVAATQYADAVAPLRKAIGLEPFYAAPHYALGQALERTNDSAGAKEAYTKFLALAPRRDPARAAATQRLTALGGATK